MRSSFVKGLVRIAFSGTAGYEGVFNEVHALKTIVDVSRYEVSPSKRLGDRITGRNPLCEHTDHI
jgi:hypothetical protein